MEMIYKKGNLPQTKALLERAIALPISVNMDDATIEKFIAAVKNTVKELL
jgi:dTDP-4-amino-4,6-dideoxygalactose transaminase